MMLITVVVPYNGTIRNTKLSTPDMGDKTILHCNIRTRTRTLP